MILRPREHLISMGDNPKRLIIDDLELLPYLGQLHHKPDKQAAWSFVDQMQCGIMLEKIQKARAVIDAKLREVYKKLMVKESRKPTEGEGERMITASGSLHPVTSPGADSSKCKLSLSLPETTPELFEYGFRQQLPVTASGSAAPRWKRGG